MTDAPPASQPDARVELVFALVGPLGAPLDRLNDELKGALARFGYDAVPISLSALFKRFPQWSEPGKNGEAARIGHLQTVANRIRAGTGDPAILARAAMHEIRAERKARSGDADQAAPARAYIISQLKHPAEVKLLRQVYGPAFHLIAAHASKRLREEALSKRLAQSLGVAGEEAQFKAEAVALIQTDEKSAEQGGQNVRDAYPLADAFVGLDPSNVERTLPRYVDLIFGHPFHTPSPEEYAMYQASALSLRSSDISRQVGAVIVNIKRDAHERDVRNADILAVGLNEVPKGGGGFYWGRESPDARDQALLRFGEDRAEQFKLGILTELLAKLDEEKWLGPKAGNGSPSERAQELFPKLAGTRLMQLAEFSRPVHAEMAALIDAARRGVAIDGRAMFVTTFPCHTCAKHIVASGLQKVVYLEPYPKSRAGQLFEESLVLECENGQPVDGKVVFCAYSGIGPRQYRGLFSMADGRAKLSLKDWDTAKPRELKPVHVPVHLWRGYVAAEREETEGLATAKYSP